MDKHTEWILNEIKHICITYKERTAGAQSVKDAQKDMGAQLKNWADSLFTEQFRLSPHAFIGSIPLQAVLGLVGGVCFFLSGYLGFFTWLCLAAFVIALLSALLEYVLYLPAFDFLYPQADGQNMYAERKAKGESKRKVIICGHADAAFEMPLFSWRNPLRFYTLIAICYGMIPFMIVANIVFGIGGTAPSLVFRIIILVLCCAYIPFLFFARWKVIADGANDNLTGCFLGMSLLKEMADNDFRFEHTDVGCLITDGEEAGLRGSTAFARRHKGEILDESAIVIIADTIYDTKSLMVYDRGINMTQKNSMEVCNLLIQAGKNCGVELPLTDFYPGANDSEAFSREGIKSAAICGVDHVPKDYYHSHNDTWSNMQPDCVEITRKILKEAVRLYDEGSF